MPNWEAWGDMDMEISVSRLTEAFKLEATKAYLDTPAQLAGGRDAADADVGEVRVERTGEVLVHCIWVWVWRFLVRPKKRQRSVEGDATRDHTTRGHHTTRTVAQQPARLVGLGPEPLPFGRVVRRAQRGERDEAPVHVFRVRHLPAVRAGDPGLGLGLGLVCVGLGLRPLMGKSTIFF